MKRLLGFIPLTASLVIASAIAAPAGKRLIETKAGVQFWASPAEMTSLSEKSHIAGKCGGFMDITDYPISRNAPRTVKLLLAGQEPKEQARVTPLLRQADPANLIAIITKLAAFENRNYQTAEGVAAANWIKSEYERLGANRSDVKVELIPHRFKQPSVIATLAGNGPKKNEIVVIGGHLDSISPGAAPGADDNASGTATVMETFRILIDSGYQPNRTIQFMGYAGEEEGLLGSQDIATQYRNAGKSVVGAMQFDMTMFPGATPRMTFIMDHVNLDLTRFVQRLTDEYVKMNWIEDKCGYACSDHASWTRAGYASTFPFETSFDEYNKAIHTPRDTMEKLDPNHGTGYLKLAIAFGIELAESDAPASGEPTPTPPSGGGGGSSWPSFSQR